MAKQASDRAKGSAVANDDLELLKLKKQAAEAQAKEEASESVFAPTAEGQLADDAMLASAETILSAAGSAGSSVVIANAAAGASSSAGLSTNQWLGIGAGVVAAGAGIGIAASSGGGGGDDPVPQTITVAGSTPTISEGGAAVVYTVTTTGFEPGQVLSYTITGVNAADVNVPLTGTLFINAGGSATLAVSANADALVGEMDTISFSVVAGSVVGNTVTTAITDTTPAPAIEVAASVATISEGGDAVVITINTTGLPIGQVVNYEITGVNGTDLSVPLTGQVTINAGGSASVVVSALADANVAEVESLTFRATAGATVSNAVTVAITDTTPVPAITVTPSATSVDEGGDAVSYAISTVGFAQGDTVSYTITGVTADEVSIPLTGTVTLDSAGRAVLSLSAANDNTLDDLSTISIAFTGKNVTTTVTTTVNDTTAERGVILTTGDDVVTGNVFTGDRVLVPGTGFLNTIGDDDVLTGVGENPTLNIEIGGANDISDNSEIQPTLIGVETVNIEWIENDQAAVNFADADDALTTLNVNRVTANNNSVSHIDLGDSVANLSVNDATRTGDINFQYREEVLTGTDEVLAVGINDARARSINFVEGTDLGADAGFFFEEINVTTTGINDIDNMTIQANGREDLLLDQDDDTTRQSLNFDVQGMPTTVGLEINNLTAVGVEDASIIADASVEIAKDAALALDALNDGITTDDLEFLEITGAGDVTIDGLDTSDIKMEARGITLTVDASTMTGDLRLGVQTASDDERSGDDFAFSTDKDLSVTSGSGDDEIVTYEALAGDITTNAGDDIVSITNGTSVRFVEGEGPTIGSELEFFIALIEAIVNGTPFDFDFGNIIELVEPSTPANVEGVSTISTGEGDDVVTALDLETTATDRNVEDNGDFDDVRGAVIDTGTGSDSVTVRSLLGNRDWDNLILTDANRDDLWVAKGPSILTGADADTVNLGGIQNGTIVAEGSLVDTGSGDDELNVTLDVDGDFTGDTFSYSYANRTVLAADTDADQITLADTINGAAGDRTREVSEDGTVNRLGAVVDMGEGDDVANFTEELSFAESNTLIVGRDAELRSAETVNVVALDNVRVTTTTSMADQDETTAGVQTDINANVLGTVTLNLTIANQINGQTELDSTRDANDRDVNDGFIYVDILRFDDALETVNLISEEEPVLLDAENELHEQGTETTYNIDNMRTDVELTLVAQEATGVVDLDGDDNDRDGFVDQDFRGDLGDDSTLVIDRTTAEVFTDANRLGSRNDVQLFIDYADVRGLNDSATLNVSAESGAFDIDIFIDSTQTDVIATDEDGANGDDIVDGDDDAEIVENFTIIFNDTNSHAIAMNGFGDVVHRETDREPEAVADVSSTANTSFVVQTAAGEGERIDIDEVNADLIAVRNVDGTGVTAADVTLRVDASNNYTIITGTGDDTLDLRDDNVRADDIETAVDRRDRIDANTGRDILIINGSDSLGRNDNVEFGLEAEIIDDDVFGGLRGVEKIIVDADHNFGVGEDPDGVIFGEASLNGFEILDITLDEQAAITGVDTIAIVGGVFDPETRALGDGEDAANDQRLNLVLGNNFILATDEVDNDNGSTIVDAEGNVLPAFVVDGELHNGYTSLNIEAKDDDEDLTDQVINLDIRLDSDGGADLQIVNSGDSRAFVQVTLFTADERDNLNVLDGTVGPGDGNVGILVYDRLDENEDSKIDRIVVEEGEGADNGGAEADAFTLMDLSFDGEIIEDVVLDDVDSLVQIDDSWTADAFEFDASAVEDTDEDTSTGGLVILAALEDTAELTLRGTDNDDYIVAGRGADLVEGNGGDDIITGDEVIDQNELEVFTFAATYDVGDVIRVTHNGDTMEATITGLNMGQPVTGAQVAEAFALFDGSLGVNTMGVAGITVDGDFFAGATTTFDAATRQLRAEGIDAGVDYEASAEIDNVGQAQTLSLALDASVGPNTETTTLVVDGTAAAGSFTVLYDGVNYTITFNSAAAPGSEFGGDFLALVSAVEGDVSIGFVGMDDIELSLTQAPGSPGLTFLVGTNATAGSLTTTFNQNEALIDVIFQGQTYRLITDGEMFIQPAMGLGINQLTAAVALLGGTLTRTMGSEGSQFVIEGPAPFPQITGTTVINDDAVVSLSVTNPTNQPAPTVVTETLARVVEGDADEIIGGAGNDRIAGLIGGDTLDGGAGTDTLDYTLSNAAVQINLAANTAAGGHATGDTIANFENVDGSLFDDALIGNDEANVLNGFRGDDTIDGGAGDDIINGGKGADTITGGAGDDTIDVGAGDEASDTVIVSSGSGVDTISGFNVFAMDTTEADDDKIEFSDFENRDELDGSLLQQTAAFGMGPGVAISGNDTELLVVTDADFDVIPGASIEAQIAAAINGAFDVTNLSDGVLIFSVQDTASGDSYIGYYTNSDDASPSDTVSAADIELIAVVDDAFVGKDDFWLPSV